MTAIPEEFLSLTAPATQILAALDGSLDAALKVLAHELPGWWWSAGSCCVSDDARIAPDFNCPVHGERLRAELFPIEPGDDFDAGFDIDLRPSGQPGHAMLMAIVDAIEAVQIKRGVR